MRTIALDGLGADAEHIARDLQRGERVALSYHGESLGEVVPAVAPLASVRTMTPLEALDRLEEITARDPAYRAKAEAYLVELEADRKAWGERSP
jgi:hypothetical protein